MSGLNTRPWTAYLLFFNQHLHGDPRGRGLMRTEAERLAPSAIGRKPNRSEVKFRLGPPKRWG